MLQGMSDDRDQRPGSLLGWIAAAGAALFIITVAVVVILQTVLPVFGIKVGSPPDGVIGSMLVFALISLGLLPAAAWFRRDK